MPIQIPPNISFADLKFRLYHRNGSLLFEHEPLLAFCKANGLTERVLDDEDILTDLICEWYILSRRAGEPPNLAMEMLHQDQDLSG